MSKIFRSWSIGSPNHSSTTANPAAALSKVNRQHQPAEKDATFNQQRSTVDCTEDIASSTLKRRQSLSEKIKRSLFPSKQAQTVGRVGAENTSDANFDTTQAVRRPSSGKKDEKVLASEDNSESKSSMAPMASPENSSPDDEEEPQNSLVLQPRIASGGTQVTSTPETMQVSKGQVTTIPFIATFVSCFDLSWYKKSSWSEGQLKGHLSHSFLLSRLELTLKSPSHLAFKKLSKR